MIWYFVCSGNTCRSPMAAALARARLAAAGRLDIGVFSAGLQAAEGEPATPEAIAATAAAAEPLPDLAVHRAHRLDAGDVFAADRIFTMTRQQAEALRDRFPEQSGRIAALDPGVDVFDPFGRGREAYDEVLAQLAAAVAAEVARHTPLRVALAADGAGSALAEALAVRLQGRPSTELLPPTAHHGAFAAALAGAAAVGWGGAGAGNGPRTPARGPHASARDAPPATVPEPRPSARGVPPAAEPQPRPNARGMSPNPAPAGEPRPDARGMSPNPASAGEPRPSARGVPPTPTPAGQPRAGTGTPAPKPAPASEPRVPSGPAPADRRAADFAIVVAQPAAAAYITANRLPGVRAAWCRRVGEARSARADCDANVLCLSPHGRSVEGAAAILEAFLQTPCQGGAALAWVAEMRRRDALR